MLMISYEISKVSNFKKKRSICWTDATLLGHQLLTLATQCNRACCTARLKSNIPLLPL